MSDLQGCLQICKMFTHHEPGTKSHVGFFYSDSVGFSSILVYEPLILGAILALAFSNKNKSEEIAPLGS